MRALLSAVLQAGQAGLTALKEAFPAHAREVRRLFIDRLTPEQLDQVAEISSTILSNLQADQVPLSTS